MNFIYVFSENRNVTQRNVYYRIVLKSRLRIPDFEFNFYSVLCGPNTNNKSNMLNYHDMIVTHLLNTYSTLNIEYSRISSKL